MAEIGALEIDEEDYSAISLKAMEMTDKFLTLMDRMVDTDDYSLAQTIDQALETLFTLKNVKDRPKLSLELEDKYAVPDAFLCPISGKIMGDPVVLCNGKTYDRPFIEKWLRKGNQTCPQTKEVLEHTTLTPNEMVWKLISDWCDKFCIERPATVPNSHDEVIANANRERFNLLLEKITSASIPDQKAAAKEFRLLSKQVGSIRAFFGESSDNITRLLSPLSLGNVSSDPDLHEDLITTVLNVSIPVDNKKLVAEHCVALPLLIESLESGTLTARTNAAAAIFALSALESNQRLFGSACVIKPLIDLLEDVEPVARKDVVQVVLKLFLFSKNKTSAIRGGAVNMLLSKIKVGIAIDECTSILSILSDEGDAVVQMYELGAIPCVFKILRESKCERVQENCVMIISAIFFHDESYEDNVIEEEWTYSTLDYLAAHGTVRVRSKAATIVESIYAYTSK